MKAKPVLILTRVDILITVSDMMWDGELDLSSIAYDLGSSNINTVLSHFVANNVVFADKII